MTAREWQPGDVAMLPDARKSTVTHPRGCPHAAEPHWHHADGGWDYLTDFAKTARPLVVIDPEDREAVERLLDSLRGMSFAAHACGAFTCLQAALREFANPTPPKPAEPLGLGAVVEDAEGERWVRVNQLTGTQEWRCCDFNGAFRKYAAINAVRVLSEGVTS